MRNLMTTVLSVIAAVDTGDGAVDSIFTNVETLIYNVVIPAILWIVGVVCLINAILIGVNMTQAKTPEDRDAAKKKLVWFLVGLAVSFILAFSVPILINYLGQLFRIGK